MPTYVFECKTHGAFEDFRHITQFVRELPCPECGRIAHIVPCNTQRHKNTFEPHYNDSAGRYFHTKKQFHSWMREHGSVLA